jgi:Zn-finger nucleic acid-binding protein
VNVYICLKCRYWIRKGEREEMVFDSLCPDCLGSKVSEFVADKVFRRDVQAQNYIENKGW